MASLENNRMYDSRTLGAFTRLAHSLNELTVPQATSSRVDRQHALQCNAFRVEYTTAMKGSEESVTDVAIIPYCPPGFKEDAYRLSPKPNAEVLARLTKVLTKAQTKDTLGSSLLNEISSITKDFPEYRWMGSVERGAGIASEDELGIPLLPRFSQFLLNPYVVPRYVMESTLGDETQLVSAWVIDKSIYFTFQASRQDNEEEQAPKTLKMRYAGPSLDPHDPPEVIGQRLMNGMREIMKHSLRCGALDTYEDLASTYFKAPFLEVEHNSLSAAKKIAHTRDVKPQRYTLSSGALTILDIDPELATAQIRIQAHKGAGAAALIFNFSRTTSIDREIWLTEVSDAYRQISSSSESARLCGFYRIRQLGPAMEYLSPNLLTLLRREDALKLLNLASEHKIEVDFFKGHLNGPMVSILKMLSICDGIQEVSFCPGSRPVITSMFGDLTLGFAPDGSLHFSAKNELGGAFEGLLHTSILKDEGEQGKAAYTLLDALVRQETLQDRRHFENVALNLVDSDKSGYSYVISEGHTSYCSLPPSTDSQACTAYELGVNFLNVYVLFARHYDRLSVHYAEPGTCHVLLGSAETPFEMGLVITGSSLTEINFSPALPPYSDPIRREAPSLRVSTSLELLNNPQSAEATTSLIMNYARYSKESRDKRLTKPLTDSDVYRSALSLATQPSNGGLI